MQRFNGRTLIAGVGSALVDILLKESEEFLAATAAAKGGMTLVEAGTIQTMLATSTAQPQLVPGGSACNTILGIGKLGGPARFVGKRGTDELGDLFENALERAGVEPLLHTTATATGRVLSLITPDAQRSMFTYLGAASELGVSELSARKFDGAAIVHLEGYLLFNPALMMAALEAAKSAGSLISLDMASFTVVQSTRDLLEKIIADYIDIVIANEDEARAYTGESDELRALDILAQQAPVAVVKVGKRGSYIRHAGALAQIGIFGDGSALDTTGAGDLWAAGFLYGLVHGYDIERSGTLGAACGAEVCQVIGAHIPEEGWARIKSHL
jgi:sugar/nucleoside kinase (ribokinase family)